MDECREWYDEQYKSEHSEQHFPNEELCRFLYRCFPNKQDRSKIRVVEVGCGEGANLLYMSREGFDVYGIDYSNESIFQVPILYSDYQQELPKITCQNMMDMSFCDGFFDVVVDVFSTNCLTEAQYDSFLVELHRILKDDGLYFSFTPSKGSDAFKNYQPSSMIDASTLNGISRPDSPYAGNQYPFRFMSVDEAQYHVEQNGMKVEYLETLSRSYFKRKEQFEFLLIQAVKTNT